jgi:hypothetical protein
VIDPLVAVTILAIYTAAALVIYGLARSEIWQVRQARERFYAAHVDKVTRLERAKETELISTIYQSPKLKSLFSRADGSQTEPTLTREERAAIEAEIEGIKSGLKAVADARGTFDLICADFDVAADVLHRAVLYGMGLSLVVPAIVIALAIPAAQGDAEWVLFASLAVFYFGFLRLANPINTFRRTSKRLRESQLQLTKMVEVTIYGLPASAANTPPATDP